MASTVLDFPDWFDESAINEILGERLFEAGELHPEEKLDLWGFVKYYVERSESPAGGMVVHPQALAAFDELCRVVDRGSLRYDLDGTGPKSPYRLAAHVSRQSRPSPSNPTDSTRRGPWMGPTDEKVVIDIDRLRDTHDVGTPPPFTVERLDDGDRVRLTVADTDIELTEAGVRGTDPMGNGYCIPKAEIDADGEPVFSRDADLRVTNGITEITFAST